MKSIQETRNSNVETLRIFEMFCIVISHSSVHGKFINIECVVNNFFLDFMKLGNLGVDVFVIISGCFFV